MRTIPAAVRNNPYLTANIAFSGVILLIMVYSAIFSPLKDNYPVTCLHERITGEPCVSCGLSHSFSLILRGKFDEAHNWNVYGMRVFLFFAAQFLMRILFSVVYFRNNDSRKQLIIFDIAGSIILFFLSFHQFLVYIFKYS
jgi:hypothetical protein